jgi:DNA-binding PucR family transcriptional regulator
LAESDPRNAILQKTLLTYFSTGHNAASAAAALGVNERTVRNRVRTAEQLLGRPLEAHSAGIEIALRLLEMGPGTAADL